MLFITDGYTWSNIIKVTKNLEECIKIMQSYVPMYNLAVPPVYDLNRKCIVAGVKVQGNGDYLPRYAGNLDIINNAAIYVAEQLTL